MATLLHQQLKTLYVANSKRHEMTVDEFRIDAIDGRGRLIEIQCASLSAIRDKIHTLLMHHRVIVVKPLAARKIIVKLQSKGGAVISSRMSPARETLSHLFRELVHFGVFPHPRLQLDVLLTDQEEIRVPPVARASWRKKYSVEDRRLLLVNERVKLRTAIDLWKALGIQLPSRFTTADIEVFGKMPRWLAQKAAFCFRRMSFFDVCGKQGNAILYGLSGDGDTRRPRAA